MASEFSIPQCLNEQQIMMLRLFRKPMPESDFLQMRRLAIKILSKQLDESIEEWESQNNITEETYELFAKGHYRSSTRTA